MKAETAFCDGSSGASPRARARHRTPERKTQNGAAVVSEPHERFNEGEKILVGFRPSGFGKPFEEVFGPMVEHRLKQRPFVGEVVVDEISRDAGFAREVRERDALEAAFPEGTGGNVDDLLFSLGVRTAIDGFSHFVSIGANVCSLAYCMGAK